MKTISIFNFKGGVGKTVSAINISSILAEKGFKILLVDMDSQSSLSSTFEVNDITKPSIGELLTDDDYEIKDVLVHTEVENIDILPCNKKFAKTERLMWIDTSKSVQYRLKNVLDRVKESGYEYDYCIIDCPPADGIASMNSLVASDEVLIPIKIGKYAYDGIGRLMKEIKNIQEEFNPNLSFKSCFVTMADNRTNLTKIVVEMLEEEKLGDKLAKTQIRNNIALEEAIFMNKPVKDYKDNSNASQDYKALVKELFNV